MKKKKLLSALLTICMLLSVIPAMSITASASTGLCPECGAELDFLKDSEDEHCVYCSSCDYLCWTSCAYADCLTCNPCNHEDTDSYTSSYKSVGAYHQLTCDRCNEAFSAKERHSDSNGDLICDVCGYSPVYAPSCGCDNTKDNGEGYCVNCEEEICYHDYIFYMKCKGTCHQLTCYDCGKTFSEPEEHYDNDDDGYCDVCEFDFTATVYPASCGSDCDNTEDDGNGYCVNCGEKICYHDYYSYTYDDTYHQITCDDCGKTFSEQEEHCDDDIDGYCDVCDYEFPSIEYNIIINTAQDSSQTNHGYITTDASTSYRHEWIDVTVYPESGYAFDKLTVKSGEIEIECYEDGENEEGYDQYSFYMPAAAVTVSATFRAMTESDCAAYLVAHTKNADGTAADTTRQLSGSYTYKEYDKAYEDYTEYSYDFNGFVKVVNGETRYYYETGDMAIDAAVAGKTNMTYVSDTNKNGVIVAGSGNNLYSGNDYLNPDLGDYTDTVVLLQDYGRLYHYYGNKCLGTVAEYNSHECKYGIHKGIIVDLNGHSVASVSGGLIAEDETLVIKNGTINAYMGDGAAYDDEGGVSYLTGEVVFSNVTMSGKIFASEHTFTFLNGLYSISFDAGENPSSVRPRGGYYISDPSTMGLNIDFGDYRVEAKEGADEATVAEFNAVSNDDYDYEYRIIKGQFAYQVTCADCENGSVSAGDPSIYSQYATVTLSAKPASGYILDGYTAYKTGDENTTVTVTDGTFTMPNYAVTVSATFKELPAAVKNATYSAYLALNENIDICLKIKSLGTGFSKDKLSVTVDGKAIDNNKIKVDATTASCVLVEVAPQDIDTVCNVVVTYDGVVVKSFSYSAVKYCNSVFAKDTSGELHDLCEALLNYGKCAGSSVTVSDDHTKDFKDYTFKNIPTKETSGKNAIGASLSIGEIITLKYTVESNAELTNTNAETQNFYVMIGDKQIDPKRVTVTSNGENSYTVSIDLYASQLSESYTLVPKNSDVGDFSVTYSAYNYCKDAQTQTDNKFTDTVKTLCKAIHNYGEAVKAYNSK